MKYFINIMNCLLIVIISSILYTTPIEKSKTMKIDVETKELKSDKIIVKQQDEETTSIEDVEPVEKSTQVIEKTVEEKTESSKEETKFTPVVEKEVEKTEPVSNSDILETQVGKMSGYGPDCIGCSGYVSSGKYVGNGNIYYNDSTYGTVRIVAGDRKYSLGSIVRIKNSKVSSNPILAIVLDRGSSIGINKTFMFDLLFENEDQALKYEVSYNVTFEILRNGY